MHFTLKCKDGNVIIKLFSVLIETTFYIRNKSRIARLLHVPNLRSDRILISIDRILPRSSSIILRRAACIKKYTIYRNHSSLLKKNFAYIVHIGVYGDVQRVKILYNKKDSALIQMAEPHQALLGECTSRETRHLRRFEITFHITVNNSYIKSYIKSREINHFTKLEI